MTELELLHVPNQTVYLDEPVFIGDIPEFGKWREMRLVHSPYPGEWLFYIRDVDNNQLALKLYRHHDYNYFYQAFQYQKQIESFLHDYPSFSRDRRIAPGFGVCSGGSHVYFLLAWKHEYRFGDELNGLPVYEKLKPALSAATYIKAAESILLDCPSSDWANQVKQRLERCFNQLMYRADEPAAVKHFSRFFRQQECVLATRRPSVCYREFSPDHWYSQPDGTVRIPLISHWIHADTWYHFRRLLTDIFPESQALAVFMVDMYFDFAPPRDFFICLAIYTMLDLFEQLCEFRSLRCEQAQVVLTKIRAVDHMYAKFTRSVPTWYKPLNHNYTRKMDQPRFH